MKSVIFGLSVMLCSALSSAADINCGGTVTLVMGDHPSCQGNMAFKTDSSAGKWMCTKSNEAGSIVLAALMAGRSVSAFIDDAGAASCADLPSYRQISYVIIS